MRRQDRPTQASPPVRQADAVIAGSVISCGGKVNEQRCSVVPSSVALLGGNGGRIGREHTNRSGWFRFVVAPGTYTVVVRPVDLPNFVVRRTVSALAHAGTIVDNVLPPSP